MAKCIKLIVPALSCYCGAKEVFGVCGEDYLQLAYHRNSAMRMRIAVYFGEISVKISRFQSRFQDIGQDFEISRKISRKISCFHERFQDFRGDFKISRRFQDFT